MKELTVNHQSFAETAAEVPATQDESHDEQPEVHTAREVELENELAKMRIQIDQLTKANRELFIRAGGEDDQVVLDPVAATDERLLNIVKGGFSARSIKEV